MKHVCVADTAAVFTDTWVAARALVRMYTCTIDPVPMAVHRRAARVQRTVRLDCDDAYTSRCIHICYVYFRPDGWRCGWLRYRARRVVRL